MSVYQPQLFEKKLIDLWEKEKVNKTPVEGEKQYVLVMFPYPSGAGLHTGHARVYIGTDVIARYYRMNQKAVLHPMGWDAFGLPSENAAIKLGKNPADLTKEYVANFKKQMISLGLSYDWEKELDSTDPKYYAITQWLFIQFFKAGLLYKKNTSVDFCNFCKTGLAQEEVLADGTHERCGNPVVKREIPQWIFRITKYADRLLQELDGLDWPRGILEMQRNWIGKKEGIEITYQVEGSNQTIACFTTTPVNFGATFLVLAPEHQFVQDMLSGRIKPNAETDIHTVGEYIKKATAKSEVDRMVDEKNKTGVFTGFYALNHVTKEKMPIWISDFVLTNVGTGAVQGCPGHDLRDFEFAEKFNLPIKRVVVDVTGDESEIDTTAKVIEKGVEGTMINSDFLNGLPFKQAMVKTMDYFEEKNWGRRVVSYHLRDWIFSRQRYWGEPIPMIYCEKCSKDKITYKIDPNNSKVHQKISENWNEIRQEMYGWFPISEQELPLELPYLTTYEPTGTGESPLSQVEDWVSTKCPNCGGVARRETDTMPNWAGSSWYFLAYPFWNKSQKEFKFDTESTKAAIDHWLPVDWYIGGAEHAVLHLLYARFWTKILQDLGYIDFNEPFLKLRSVGIVIAEDHRKMSKSYGNVVNPDNIIQEYGCDALRVYEMFMAPFGQEIAWSTKALQGSYRFVKRIWHLFNDFAKFDEDMEKNDEKVVIELQKSIVKITSDITDVKFNTCVSSMMQFLNVWEAGGTISKEDGKKFLQILAPFAPFISDYIWREVMEEKDSIHISSWPKADESQLRAQTINLPIQVDGKVRDIIKIAHKASEEEVKNKALTSDKVTKWVKEGYLIKYIPGKILNFVNKS